ncbi:DUF7322 domain-containing protein [Haloarcula salina]|uniref:DUF7322 domain-containing protein n=1 Tax=Haloarcula salina TaxID=1429914 RepID=UPI003C702E7D
MIDGPGEDDEGGSVLSEKSEFEPEEFDPDSLGPNVPTPSSEDYQSDAAGLFVRLVVVFNVALLALSIGPMLAYFEGQVDLGLRIFLAGVILFAYGTYRYVRFERERTARDDGADGEAEDGPDGETDDASESDADPNDRNG